jgi:hypothetical protein
MGATYGAQRGDAQPANSWGACRATPALFPSSSRGLVRPWSASCG